MSLFAEYEQDFKGMVASIIKRCGKIPDLDGGTLAEDTLPPCTTSSYYINIIYGSPYFDFFLAKPHPCVAYFRTLRRTKLLHLDQWLLAVDLANEMCDDHTSNHAVLPFHHNISSAAKAEENSAAEREVDDARELVRSVHQHVRSVRGPAVCTRQS